MKKKSHPYKVGDVVCVVKHKIHGVFDNYHGLSEGDWVIIDTVEPYIENKDRTAYDAYYYVKHENRRERLALVVEQLEKPPTDDELKALSKTIKGLDKLKAYL